MFAFGLLTQSGASPRTNEFPQGKPPFFSSTEEGYWNALDAAFILIMVTNISARCRHPHYGDDYIE